MSFLLLYTWLAFVSGALSAAAVLGYPATRSAKNGAGGSRNFERKKALRTILVGDIAVTGMTMIITIYLSILSKVL